MEMSPASTVDTKIDKDFVYVTLTTDQVQGREYDMFTISQQIANQLVVLKPCDMDNDLQANPAMWTEYIDNVNCKVVWEGKFPIPQLMACGMTVYNAPDPNDPVVNYYQKITFTVFSKVTDEFLFGYTPAITKREVFRSYDVSITLENFVSGSISFTLHAPPEMLNAIIRERYDVNRQVYEIDVVKIVQAHFEIEAVSIVYPSQYNVALVIGATDRLEIETPPPCSIPGTFRINYKIRCFGMVCRDASWNDAYVEFVIPADEMCPTVSKTYSPTMELNLCADAACSAYTSDHILGYVVTLEAKVTMEPPIRLTRFYTVEFSDASTGLARTAKDAFVITSFGNFLQYSDVDGDLNGVNTFDFTPAVGTGDNELFYTPDIFTSRDYSVKVTMYVEADLTQTVKKAFLVSNMLVADVDVSARSYATAKSGVTFSDKASSEESSTSAGLIVGVVVAAVVAVAAVAFFIVRRRNVVSKTEHHVNMESMTTA
jgi:hypothetical protein